MAGPLFRYGSRRPKSFEWREIQLRTNDGLTAVVESGLNANEKIRAKPKVKV